MSRVGVVVFMTPATAKQLTKIWISSSVSYGIIHYSRHAIANVQDESRQAWIKTMPEKANVLMDEAARMKQQHKDFVMPESSELIPAARMKQQHNDFVMPESAQQMRRDNCAPENMLRSVVDVSTNVSITLTNEDTKTRNCSLICDFQGDREKNDNAKDGRSVRVIESDDAKDGRSVRPDQRKMNHADRKYVLIGLQAL